MRLQWNNDIDGDEGTTTNWPLLFLEERAHHLIGQTLEHFNQLDLLINLLDYSSLLDEQEHRGRDGSRMNGRHECWHYERTMREQLDKPVHLSLAAYGALARTRGSVVNITTSCRQQSCANPAGGEGASREQPPHQQAINGGLRIPINSRELAKVSECMGKAAMTTFSKSLAHQYAPLVRVNCICLGPIASEILGEMGLRSPGSGTVQLNAADRDDDPREPAGSRDIELPLRQTNQHQATRANGSHDKMNQAIKLKALNNNRQNSAERRPSASITGIKEEEEEGALEGGGREQVEILKKSRQEAALEHESEELAKMIIYLSSRERGSFITGSRVSLGARI